MTNPFQQWLDSQKAVDVKYYTPHSDTASYSDILEGAAKAVKCLEENRFVKYTDPVSEEAETDFFPR